MKNLQVLSWLLIFILSWHTQSYTGLAEGSLIATANGPVPIQNLKVGDRVISYQTDGSLVQAAVTKVLPHRTDSLFCLYITPHKFIIASPHQPFYDVRDGFIEAQYITNQHTIISIFPYSFSIWKTCNTYVSPKNSLMSLDVYSIEIEYPHTYFVSDSSFSDYEEVHTFILTHNGLPALGVGASVIFEKALTTVSFGQAALSAGGLGLTAGPTGLIIGGVVGLGWVGYNLFFKKDTGKQNVVYIEQADQGPRKNDPNQKDPKDKKECDYKVCDFEKKISKMPPGERVAAIRVEAERVAKAKGLKKDGRISEMNKRIVYQDKKNNKLYSVDTQHGRFEMLDLDGKHLGEFDFHFRQTKPADQSGRHNLRVK